MFHHGFHLAFRLLYAIKFFFERNKMFHHDFHLAEVEGRILNAALVFMIFRRHVGKYN